MLTVVSRSNVKEGDRDFAWQLYSEEVAPFVSKFVTWIDSEERKKFNDSWPSWQNNILVLGDQPIGWFALIEDEKRVSIEQLFVIRKYQNKGLGGAVLDYLLEKHTSQRKEIQISVLKDSPSRHWISGRGFSMKGENKLVTNFVKN